MWIGWKLGVWFAWPLLILATPMLTAMLFIAALAKIHARGGIYWNELRRRYAEVSEEEAEQEASPGGRREGADLRVSVAGAALPHGGGWVTVVWLWPDGRGVVERRTLSPSVPRNVGDIRFGSGEVALTAEECARVRALAAPPFGGNVRSTVKDGAPARVVVWERGRGVVRRGSCNLAGVPKRRRGDPMIQLMMCVAELGWRAGGEALLTGSCDWSGNIELGEV